MNIVIFGATSAVAKHLARQHAERGDHLTLIGRNSQKLGVLAADLAVRGAEDVRVRVQDLAELDGCEPLINDLWQQGPEPDVAYFFQGVLPDQQACQQSMETTLSALQINTLGIMALLTPLANRFEQRGAGALVVVSSVAGDRGRQSNYVYGTSKAALNTFLQGLRNRLSKSGVRVLTIKPGFIDTPMTAEMKKGPLWAEPQTIASGILKSLEHNRNEVYLPWFWQGIMTVIKLIPEPLFKRMSL
ncbi:SDR family oxidoreductase [Ferrimonas marina]|uniref:Short-chain dehydrogenase n=1 Tax=Ferrimonas marina TaxID=299255 RepID=A0A1M5QV97_9GAMM|nr:SDR family oxidoreductase [Ferrimonas marina]SHH18087.1 hypothetical protein SAMN02745129_1375 [Ferrimonas marina]